MPDNKNGFLGKAKWGYAGQQYGWIKREHLPKEGEFIRIKIVPVNKDDKGNTHIIFVDTYEPDPNKRKDNRSDYEKKHDDNKPLDDTKDLPF